jgi:hypothetical protein
MNGRLRLGVSHARDAAQICLGGFFIDNTAGSERLLVFASGCVVKGKTQ